MRKESLDLSSLRAGVVDNVRRLSAPGPRAALLGAGVLGLSALANREVARRAVASHRENREDSAQGVQEILGALRDKREEHGLDVRILRGARGSGSFYEPKSKIIQLSDDLHSPGVLLHELGHARAHQRGSFLSRAAHSDILPALSMALPLGLVLAGKARLAAPAFAAPYAATALAEVPAYLHGRRVAGELGVSDAPLKEWTSRHGAPSYGSHLLAGLGLYLAVRGLTKRGMADGGWGDRRFFEDPVVYAARYNKDQGVLEVGFNDGGLYWYYGVEPNMWNNMKRAQDVSKFMERNFSGNQSTKVGFDKAALSDAIGAVAGVYGGSRLGEHLLRRYPLVGWKSPAAKVLAAVLGAKAGISYLSPLVPGALKVSSVAPELFPMGNLVKLAFQIKSPPAGRMSGLKRGLDNKPPEMNMISKAPQPPPSASAAKIPDLS